MSDLEYRDYEIRHDPKPIPIRAHDWTFTHKDYDGPEDHRWGTGSSAKDCKSQIDEVHEDWPCKMKSPKIEWDGSCLQCGVDAGVTCPEEPRP